MPFHPWKHATNNLFYIYAANIQTFNESYKIFIQNIFNTYLQVPQLRTDIPHLYGQNQNKSNKYP